MGERAEPLESPAGAGAEGPQARRPRPRLRQGEVLRPRGQGSEVALRLAQDARRLRGRTDADLHAHRQAARRRRRRTRCRSARSARKRPRSTCAISIASSAATSSRRNRSSRSGLLKNTKIDVKLLGSGEVSKKLTIRVHAISASAREKIEAAGGTIELLREPKVPKQEEASQGEARPHPSRARPRPTPRPAAEPSRRGTGRADRPGFRDAGGVDVRLARQRVARP